MGVSPYTLVEISLKFDVLYLADAKLPHARLAAAG